MADTVVSAGQGIAGVVVSATVILKLQVAELPAASVAVQVTVVIPRGKGEGALFESVMLPAVQLSETAGCEMAPV